MVTPRGLREATMAKAKATTRKFGGHKLPHERSFPPVWLDLIRASGDPEKNDTENTYAFAARIGTTYMTLLRWAKGQSHPRGPTVLLVRLESARLGVRSPL